MSELATPPPAREDKGLIHPDLAGSDDEAARGQDGERLQHGAGSSRPLRPRQPETQPCGAKIHGRRPIDQDEAASRFIAAPEHEKMHDERLWDLRKKRDTQAHAIREWEELRETASRIKQHTLARLDLYLALFEAQAQSNGIHVHWRPTVQSTTASCTTSLPIMAPRGSAAGGAGRA